MSKKTSFFQYSKKHIYVSPRIFITSFILLLILVLLFFLFNNRELPIGKMFFSFFTPMEKSKEMEKELPKIVTTPTPAPYPANTTGIVPGEEITARGVVVLDVDSHVYLFKRNGTMLLSPASTTKILTALVILDTFKLDDVVTVETNGSTGQLMGLTQGEHITIENLLYGELIQSGNDAALALASAYPGGYDAFIVAMNRKAKEIFMTNSTFTNPAGYDNPNHKVTPEDLSLLALAAIKNPTIRKMVAIPQITVSDVSHTQYHKLSNVNQLLGKIPGVAGIKTGWTEGAGENLVTYVERDGRKVIFVVLHSRDRFVDTIKLIDWVFENFRWENVGKI